MKQVLSGFETNLKRICEYQEESELQRICIILIPLS